MALPLVIDDSALLALLVADVEAAWDLEDDHVFVDVPEAPAGGDDLPRAYINSTGGKFDSSSTGATSLAASYINEITYQALKPGGSSSLRALKQEALQALLNLLTADGDYHGFVWGIDTLPPVEYSFGDGALEAGDGYFTVTLTFPCEADS